jgi:transcriptional regulator with XRE-family HTH domain
MTEIATLFSLGLSDSMISARLGVSRMSVNRWRHGRARPCAEVRLKARLYLGQVHALLRPVTECNAPL